MKTTLTKNNPVAVASHGKNCNGVHTATKASAWRFLKLNTYIRATLIFAVAGAGFILSGQDAYAQARLTSPSTNEALPSPTFKLRWDKVGQTETFLCLGSQQGLNDYFGKSMGTSSGVDLTWSNPPPTVWVRLWSLMPIYTGVAGSTPAYYQWQGRDYFFKVGVKVPSNVLIDAWMVRLQADNGTLGGQCKAYLQSSFASVVAQTGVKNPSGVAPFMPRTLSGYYWAVDANSGFTEVTKVYPGDSKKLESVKAMLRQVKKGDVIQYGTQVTVNEGLHTLAIVADYDGSDTIRWADSNWSAPNTVNANQSRSVDALAAIIAKDVTVSNPIGTYPKGATLYRVRRDLK